MGSISSPLRVVADENIPYAEKAFATFGDVRTLPGRQMSHKTVKNADILLVRSITSVGADLLDGSAVKFVATATIGTDHIDQEYLAERGIGFASAPGSNANSVAEYVMAALLVLHERAGKHLESSSIAVVGVGNVGSRVARYAEALGMRVVRNDPPLSRSTGDPVFRPLDEAIGCDVVTLHVPLTREGEDKTFHMAYEGFFERMSPGSIFVNSSRGAVADSRALLRALEAGRITAVLDVWEGEPGIDIDLLRKTELATPHIAGYSFDGKVNATAAIYRAACGFFEFDPSWDSAACMPPPEVAGITIDCAGKDEEDIVRETVLSIYDIRRDDAAMRKTDDLPEDERSGYFDGLRKEYPRRREFFNTTVTLKNASERVKKKLGALGFKLIDTGASE